MKLIKGNTYPIKEQLKGLGGKWNADMRAWEVPDDKEQEALKLLSSQPAKPQFFPKKRSSSPASFKRCWECGCSFTYADAKRYGGDWKDSYCGC